MIDSIELDELLEEIDTVYLHEFYAEGPMAKAGDNNQLLSAIDKRLNALEDGMKRSAPVEGRLKVVEDDILKARGFWLGLKIAGTIVAVAVTVAIGLAGWCLYDIHQLDVKVGKIQEKLADGGLGQIVASILSKPLSDQNAAEKSLAAAATILRGARTGSTPTTSDNINTIASRISKAQSNFPDVARVWDASSAFISYRSRTLDSAQALIDRVADGKNCSSSGGIPSGFQYANCDVSLEDVGFKLDDAPIRDIRSGKDIALRYSFRNSVIRYHGGVLPDGVLYFYNCIFLFDVQNVPPRRGIQTLEALTKADNLISVQIGE